MINSFHTFFSVFLTVCVLLTQLLSGTPSGSAEKETALEEKESRDPFVDLFYKTVLRTIDSVEVEGLPVEQFDAMRPELARYWTEVVKTGCIIDEGSDEMFRFCFVTLQGIIEHVLAQELGKSISSLMAVIHTPQPATPVCTKGEISSDLVDQAVLNDPSRSSTVKSRAVIVRSMLARGGDIYIVYPKGGKELRTAEQRKIYEEELKHYPTHLFDCELDRGPFDLSESDLIGAFYLFKHEDNQYAFAIQITQANDIRKQGRYALWFGPLTHPEIRDRISIITQEVLIHSSKPIPTSA